MATDKWYSDPTMVAAFGVALTDAGVLEDTDDFKQYMSKPFKYNEMYEAWVEADFPESDTPQWDEFVEAISSEEEEEEEEDDEEGDDEEEEDSE